MCAASHTQKRSFAHAHAQCHLQSAIQSSSHAKARVDLQSCQPEYWSAEVTKAVVYLLLSVSSRPCHHLLSDYHRSSKDWFAKKRYEGIQVFRVAHLLILWIEYRASRQNTLMKGQIQQLQNNNILISLLKGLLRRHSLGSSRDFSTCVTSLRNVWATLLSQFPRKM